MTEYKLTYFNGRGKAEIIRLIFTQAKLKFADVRLNSEEWQKMKPSTPKGQLPVLEFDGKMMCESMAIARYLSREYGLFGANNLEYAQCEMILDSVTETADAAIARKFRSKTDEEIKAADEKVKTVLQRFEKFVAATRKGKYVLGEQISIADISIFVALDFMTIAYADFKSDDYLALSEIKKSFADQPHIAEYLKDRPQTEW